MKFMRKAALGSAYSVLSMSLFGFGFLLSLLLVLGNAATIKSALAESGFYSSLVQNALAQEQNKNETSSVPLNQPEIKAAIEQAFPAAKLEQDGSKIIDGMYGWLQGNTATPQFSVDLRASKEQFAASMGHYVQQRLSALPVCTGPVASVQVDVYNATCRPVNFNVAAAAEQAKRDVLLAGGPLDEPVLTGDTLKDDQGRTLAQQFQNLPSAYSDVKLTIYAAGVIAIIAALIGVFLHPKRRAGLHRVGVTILSVGVMSVVVSWVGVALLQKAIENIVSSAQKNDLLQDKIGLVIQILTTEVRNVWMLYGIGLILGGAIMLVMVKFLMPKDLPPPGLRS